MTAWSPGFAVFSDSPDAREPWVDQDQPSSFRDDPFLSVCDMCLLITLSFKKCTVMVVLLSFQTASPLESPRKLAPEASTGSPKTSRTSFCDMPSRILSKFS